MFSLDHVFCNRSGCFNHVSLSCFEVYVKIQSLNFTSYRFVGLGENPEVLAMRAPALFEVRLLYNVLILCVNKFSLQMIRQTYPNVVLSVHGP